ncbi:Ku protein [Cohnella phaseoli]|uniref:Non-homologous end joining protein Ku n=1 Tax=Cohnella phaseoli TaxID=456490 RepID=A0A3D9KR68_9BACL|nr:Ku protein [Cohnella phaseoli]RED89160.1 DNA end-binding protein Ku [Cohnella phaseoli]
MHTIWKGAITFGLVNVPVKLHSVAEEREISFKMIHRECGSHLNFVRCCPVCEKHLESSEIVKGFEYIKGKYVHLEKEDLEMILPESSKEIRILHFLDRNEINPIYLQKSYYLSPDTFGVNGYQLLIESMKQMDKAALCQVSIRSRQMLATIRVVDDCLALTTMHYPDEVRPVDAVPNIKLSSTIDQKGMALARNLIEHMSKPFSQTEHKDMNRDNLISYIQQKIAGQEYVGQPQSSATIVVDLMAALQASLEEIKSGNEIESSKRKNFPSGSLQSSSSTETA